jgi:hypothetical protein
MKTAFNASTVYAEEPPFIRYTSYVVFGLSEVIPDKATGYPELPMPKYEFSVDHVPPAVDVAPKLRIGIAVISRIDEVPMLTKTFPDDGLSVK